MLILSRRVGESIQVGDDVTVVVTEIRNGGGRPRVRLGIDAPTNVSVIRTELLDEETDGHDQSK